MTETGWKAVAKELASQRDAIMRSTGDMVAQLQGELAEAHARIAELEKDAAAS